MATVQSLGLHEPTALPYLVTESNLPANPAQADYKWETYTIDAEDGQCAVEEEIVVTADCVVWSRGGVVKRAFRLDIEGETILHAVLTWFPTSNRHRRHASPCRAKARTSSISNGVKAGLANLGKQGNAVSNGLTDFLEERLRGRPDEVSVAAELTEPSERALVVILKSQAHVYFLSGDSHVIPMPFEVSSVFPTPCGVVCQRLSETSESSFTIPSVPPNSFASVQTSFGIRSPDTSATPGRGSRPSLTISPAVPSREPNHRPRRNQIFCLKDPNARLGAVIAASGSEHAKSFGHNTSDGMSDALGQAEEILYISPLDEYSQRAPSGNSPLILALTWNESGRTYTIWTARYRGKGSLRPSSESRKLDASGIRSRRRSSKAFGLATGATTPVARRPTTLRESFGVLGSTALGAEIGDQRVNEVEDLASDLGHDFGDIGISLKSSRRVSSMLARADLATSHDRGAFTDYSTSHVGNTLNAKKRGESFGSFGGRASLGRARRSSIHGAESIMSNGTGLLGGPIDHLLDTLDDGDFDSPNGFGNDESLSRLPNEMIFSKIQTIPYESGNHESQTIASSHKAFTLVSPAAYSGSQDSDSTRISLCVVRTDSKELLVVNLLVQAHQVSSRQNPGHSVGKPSNNQAEMIYVVRAVDLRRGSGVLDACKLVDGEVCHMLILRQTHDGHGQMTLEAPWSTPVALELPTQLMIHNPFGISTPGSPSRKRDGSLKRVISDPHQSFIGLQHPTIRGEVDVVDNNQVRHRVVIWMSPRDSQVEQMLSVCDLVLNNAGAGLRLTWWEVMRWLRSRKENHENLEFTAVVVVLFTLAVPFITEKRTTTPVKPSRKKTGLLRSSSGSSIDMSSWEAMMDQEASSIGSSSPWMTGPSWKWVEEQDDLKISKKAPTTPSRASRSSTSSGFAVPTAGQKNSYLVNCASLARDFLRSPLGEAAFGPEGHLPTAVSNDVEKRRTALASVLIGLHMLREEYKLHVYTSEDHYSIRGILGPVLAQIGGWMGWENWGWQDKGYYAVDLSNMDQWLFEDSRISTLEVPPEPFQPPSIFAFAEACLKDTGGATYLSLLDVVAMGKSKDQMNRIRRKVLTLTPRSFGIAGFLASLQEHTSPIQKVEAMLDYGITHGVIDTLPDGVGALLHDAIVGCQASPPTSWSEALLELVDRDDLRASSQTTNSSAVYHKSNAIAAHEASRDFHSIGSSFLDTESFHSFDISAEADRQAITRLIFHEDRRFQEASKLVNQTRPPTAECVPEPDWTESEVLDAQKDLVQLVTMRTLAVPSGRGMINFSARVPLLTEKLPIPSFTLQCIMRPMNVTLSADRAAFTEDKVCWAFFHNGTATGLTISKGAKGIDTSWILYNKPPELTNRHAGFLLALGLNGHLKSLAKWVAFKYLTPKHTMTSIGLLLGLSASYIGTMDTLITRLLSVHVTRMLPPGAAELNLSPLTQTTGIMGLGMVYCNSQHRRMSEVMLSEIENADPEESPQEILRDEGYRLAAGFALGLINLGKSRDLRGLHDMNIVERLLTLAIGTKSVSHVHVLDRATAGATVALALIFLKSNDKAIAQKIDIPDTTHQFDYVRPDIFLLRTVAKHLILWGSIQPTMDWIQKSVPKVYRNKVRLSNIHFLSSEDMPFYNVVAGLCLSIGLRYAGSAIHQVRDLLVRYLDQFTRICRLPALNYDGKLTRNSVRNCQDVVALSAAAVMAGTGDLIVFRRLRLLHGRVDPDTPYGSHFAAHMALGALFLGGGSHTFGTSNIAVASLLCAFYPLFPTSVLDNKCHLQAFRHLWVLAAEPRCLVPRDVDSHRPLSIPISLVMKDGSTKAMTAPCLLPELTEIATIKTTSPDHWEVKVDFTTGNEAQNHLQAFRSNQSVYLRRRAAYDAPASSVFASTLQALDDSRPEPGISKSATHTALAISTAGSTRASSQQIFDWVLQLPTLKDLDITERALVLPPQQLGMAGTGMEGAKLLRGTVVDTRLMLEKATLDSGIRDRLWQLRLLFALADNEGAAADGREHKDGENGATAAAARQTWLRREIIDGLRWRVWCMGAGVEDGAQT